MTTFIVRIELHAPRKDYLQLHQWMGQNGFGTTICARDGYDYQLPTANYQFVADASALKLAEVLSQNMPKCGSIPDPWIFVSSGEETAWANLKKVAKAA